MQSSAGLVVVLGTGGTIAGTAPHPQDHTGYLAGALSAADLVAAVPALAGARLQTESVAQMDSCDMDHATWVRLVLALEHHLARPDVAGVVVTHGTDTLEETAFFLHHTVLHQGQRPGVAAAEGIDPVTMQLAQVHTRMHCARQHGHHTHRPAFATSQQHRVHQVLRPVG